MCLDLLVELFLYNIFFKYLFKTWNCANDLLRYRQELGCNILKSKTACLPLSQKPRIHMSRLPSLDRLVVLLIQSSLLNNTKFGSCHYIHLKVFSMQGLLVIKLLFYNSLFAVCQIYLQIDMLLVSFPVPAIF